MDSKTVIYYNRGRKCVLRMLVSIHSLRKHWSGPVVVLLEGDQEPWFLAKLAGLGCICREIPLSKEYPLSIKPQLHRYVTDFKYVMFLDADTLIVKPIDEYFELIEQYGFVTGNFADWKTTGGSISKRIKNWTCSCPELIDAALKYGTAVNTGINGWITGNPALEKWNEVCQRGYAKKCTNRIVDEIACQIMLPVVKHGLAGTEWGTSVRFGTVTDDTKIIHYHGHKHAGSYKNCWWWKNEHNEMCDSGFLDKEHEAFCDASAQKWLDSLKEKTMAVTLVTAVNRAYLGKFIKNYKRWQQTNFIKDIPWLIFAHKDCVHDEIWERIADEGDIKVVVWEKPGCSSPREEMLSAFVFGVAKEVTTKYWIKMDADVTPKNTKLNIPKEAWKSTLCAKAWGYTKVKSDPVFEIDGIHWLKKLDAWANTVPDFAGTQPLFEGVDIKGVRHNHKRICTFFAVEKTAWTQHLSKMCGDRMPIPSQDTLTWYCITRLGGKRNILTYNFREYLAP